MLSWSGDLKVSGTNLYLDAQTGRELAFVSHAHSDHICPHGHTLATPQTLAICAHRLGEQIATALKYDTELAADKDTRLRLLPAGHCLGSAMIHITRPEGTLLYTGDFTPGENLTCEPARFDRADYLVTECTYGLPFFRFPSRDTVITQLVDLVDSAIKENRQPIVMGYSLGKAQELCRILTDAGFPVTLHGAPHALARIYEQFDVKLGPFRRYAYEDFHGDRQLDLRERGVLVAPPNVARTPFVTRFKNPVTIVGTGWAVLKNAQFRYGVDHAVPFSDHADFGQLMETIERVSPKRIFLHHGYTQQFRDHLVKLGMDAVIAEPPAQMSLFE
jgi:Cft2 family RNA processing exonuclease